MESEGALVANLRKENQALRERNFPVLQEALTGLRKRHAEYKSEIMRLTDSIAASSAYHHAEMERYADGAARWEREVEVLKEKLRISSESVEKSELVKQLECHENGEVASINNGRLKSLVEMSTNINAFVSEFLSQIEWNKQGEEEDEEEESEEEESEEEEDNELRIELERLREKSKRRETEWREAAQRAALDRAAERNTAESMIRTLSAAHVTPLTPSLTYPLHIPLFPPLTHTPYSLTS